MIQRTKIRQSALQLIYATLQSGEKSISRELFWSIAQEKQRSQFIAAFAKAILHTARSSTLSFDALSEAVERIMHSIEGDMVNLNLRECIERYYTASQKLESALAALSLKHTDKRFENDELLHRDSLNLVQQASVCQAFREEYRNVTRDFPAYAELLAPMGAILKRRSNLEGNLTLFRDLKALPAKGEFQGLVQSYLELDELRPEAEELALPALDKQAQWDELITPLLKHYSLDRLDILDRSILYLSLHELKDRQLPLPIVISEATALAHTYSGSKSAPFIHGVLAAVSKAGDEPREEDIDEAGDDVSVNAMKPEQH